MAKKIWKDDKVNVTKLSLDLLNPRVPKYIKDYNDLNQIRTYLLEKEEVLRIAKSIVNNGYHRSVVFIVYEEKGKLIVLDGNRRLAACQFLLDPKLAMISRARKTFEELNKIFDKKQLQRVKITIAPSRREAEKEIWDIHVNQLLKPWQVLQRLRSYKRLIDSGEHDINSASSEYGVAIAKFKKELSKLYFYEKIYEQLNTVEEEEELLKSGFNKIGRLILSSNGKKFLDYGVDDRGNIVINDKGKFDEKLKSLIPYIIIKNKLNAQVTQRQLKENVFSVLDPTNFPKKKKGGKKGPRSGVLAKPDWITRGEYLKYRGEEKIKRMLKEMYLLIPDKNNYILSVSLRALLELSLYDALQKAGHITKMQKNYKLDIKNKNAKRAKNKKPLIQPKKNWSPSFREMLNYVLEKSNKIISDPQLLDALEKVVKGQTNFVENLNTFIHNVHYLPTKDDPEKIWSKFGRLLFKINSKINP